VKDPCDVVSECECECVTVNGLVCESASMI